MDLVKKLEAHAADRENQAAFARKQHEDLRAADRNPSDMHERIAEHHEDAAKTIREAIAALQPGGERKWPNTICNDIDKLLRQHIRWTQGDHSEGIYIEGWRKAARAVEAYIQNMPRAPAPVAVTVDDAMVERVSRAITEVQLWSRWNNFTEDRDPDNPIEICRYGKSGEPEIVVVKRFPETYGENSALAETVRHERAVAALSAALAAEVG